MNETMDYSADITDTEASLSDNTYIEEAPSEIPEDISEDFNYDSEDTNMDIAFDIDEDSYIDNEADMDVLDEETELQDIPEDVQDTENTEKNNDVIEENYIEGNQSDNENYNYEISPENKDDFDMEKRGEFVSADNPYAERWKQFGEEYSNDKETWDSLEDVPFAGENSEKYADESYENSDDIQEGKVANSLNDYMKVHDYSPDDYDTYCSDPEWRALMREEYPEYKLPPISQEKAYEELGNYMKNHNYGPDDFEDYSQDPQWRELQSAAYPDYEMPPLDKPDNIGEWNDLPYDMTFSEKLEAVNPEYQPLDEYGETPTNVNCQRCVPAYEMIRRGYDVEAMPCDDFESDYLSYHPYDAWENPDIQTTSGSGVEDIQNALQTYGDGARAQVCIQWDGTDSGHTFFAEQRNGQTCFYDPQNADKDVSSYFMMAAPDKTSFCRIDDIQPSSRILDCCKGAER